ncbi:glycoside hydrolase family 6 protein [Streptomyces zagrosensis]|uniref:Glucanase n=1 Tax=Streptomyces zagrosensis TaxID=1042984 RepID=A0A7W9Q9Y3_9ACTN|nr:glycoside hydrolase family 6 protein [Streptomyces zagrosensis]MBB5936353.1 endoglucanase [Streptomyces zagrosensis]
MRQAARTRSPARRAAPAAGWISALAIALGGCLPLADHTAAPAPTTPEPATRGPAPTAPASTSAAPAPAPGAERPGGASEPAAGQSAARAQPLWRDPSTAAARQLRAWDRQGRDAEAELLRTIAGRPTAEWISEEPRKRARRVTEAAEAAGKTPVLVAYHIPYRDCGNHSKGGAVDAAEYRTWADELAAVIGDREALVILEPDAVAQVVDGCVLPELRGERLDLLRHAVVTLLGLPRAKVYIDAGNAGWVPDPARLVPSLQRAGIAYADGFALNVSNFHTTATSTTYGQRLSRLLDGAHFVIDTSRNGNGPAGEGGHERVWCNPSGRALGEPPTTHTGRPRVDAYLWVKRPGESDGTCQGGPPAGSWWPSYALGLARNSER